MKFSKWLVLAVVVLVAASCSKEKETPKGYKYTLARKGDGNIIPPGKFIMMDLLFKDGKDSVWSDSRKEEFPLIIAVRDTFGMKQEEGLEELFRLLSKGDSVIMKVTAQTFFEKMRRQALPPGVDGKSDFTFFIGVKDVLDSAQVRKLSDDLRTKQMEKMKKQQEDQLAKDTVAIDAHLKEKNIVATKTASGLRYVITKQGKGEKVQMGQTAKLNYAGYLLNGKYFDTSFEKLAREKNIFMEGRTYEPLELQVPGNVIEGWNEIILLMNKGTQLTVYIPSTLAYGPNKRSEDIIENSILVFDMELVDVK